ncbi:MAG: winged helix-turn-helix domain-containing protein [Thermoleophilia bacterium]|nr:winged helix-turn-helix domain-containing protein [Gaiellaceae bacterium]MDW8338159.1 winged helix-turn-helix domain-containing protein [Thermoleophilia bacterium]
MFLIRSAIIDRYPDYELDDVLVVSESAQLRALADSTRSRIVGLLGQRAASTTELATALGMPKGTVAHHVRVLERAGLVRVVRTRRVRALTERFYGRVARVFELRAVTAEDELSESALAAAILRQVAEEAAASSDEHGKAGVARVRLTERDARRFKRRLERLADDVLAAGRPDGDAYVLSVAFFRSSTTLPSGDPDA